MQDIGIYVRPPSRCGACAPLAATSVHNTTIGCCNRPKKEKVIAEMQELTKQFQQGKDEIVKNPVVAEFLGLENTDYSECELEHAIINHLQKFIMEMGRGFAYMGRQQLIRTDTQDYYIDLVFYNVVLKCYVLIDLKVGVITHQDVGQMDMYVRMYDELKRTEGNNPTIGIVLCSETSKDIARYSILKGNEHLFAAKYLPMLPTEEVLRREIEQQKEIFYLQHNKKKPVLVTFCSTYTSYIKMEF